jgi:hypothetical protein
MNARPPPKHHRNTFFHKITAPPNRRGKSIFKHPQGKIKIPVRKYGARRRRSREDLGWPYGESETHRLSTGKARCMLIDSGGKINLGIEILPTKTMQKQMSSGPAYFEGEDYNVMRQGRNSPPVPLLILGVEP